MTALTPIAGAPVADLGIAAVAPPGPLAGRTVTFTSSSPGVAAAPAPMVTDVNGQVFPVLTYLAAGSTNIKATCETHDSNLSALTGQAAAAVATVTVAPTSGAGAVGATVQLTATVLDGSSNPLSGRVITWSTSDASVAGWSGGTGQTLVVNLLKAGSANVQAHCEGKDSSVVVITVSASAAPAATVTIAPTSLAGNPNGSAQLTATVKDAAGNVLVGRVINWASSVPGVASVTSP